MSRAGRWIAGLVILAAVGGGVAWVLVDAYASPGSENGGEAPAPSLATTTHAAGTVEVVLTPAAIAAAGIATAPVTAATLEPEVVAYGQLAEDSSRSFTVRAPLAGVLRSAPEVPWPGVGTTLADGAVVGWIEPRFAPVERIDLASRRVAAVSARESAAAELTAARAALERMRALHAEDHNVSDRALQEAQVAVDTARAHVREASDTVQILEAALAAGADADAGTVPVYPVAAERGGEVVEAPTQPGETVDAGQALVRVVRFDRLLARIDVPAGDAIAEPPSIALLVAFGAEERPLPAEPLGSAPSFDPQTPGRTLLFAVDARGSDLRPGATLTAHLRAVGEPLAGVLVPRAAVIRTGGRAWAWVAQGQRFQRREVPLDRPAADGYFAGTGWTAGEQVVVVGAQILLSEEMQSSGAGGEGE